MTHFPLFGRLRPPRAVALALLPIGLLAFAAWNSFVGLPKNPATVAEIEAEIRAAIPPGSTRSRVENWLIHRGFTYSHVPDGHDVAIQSLLRDTDRSFLIEGSIQVRWSFDEEGQLAGHEVSWVGTGP